MGSTIRGMQCPVRRRWSHGRKMRQLCSLEKRLRFREFSHAFACFLLALPSLTKISKVPRKNSIRVLANALMARRILCERSERRDWAPDVHLSEYHCERWLPLPPTLAISWSWALLWMCLGESRQEWKKAGFARILDFLRSQPCWRGIIGSGRLFQSQDLPL